MKKDVHEYVKGCDICQLSKGENVPYPGLLQPLALPEGVWVQISMDFREGLPVSEGQSVIWVIVDLFYKFAHA